MEQLNLILESILFTSGRPLKTKELAKVLELDEEVIKNTLLTMVEEKKEQGIVLLNSSEGFQLATNSKFSTPVKNFLNAELREKLTDATVEVLAIIAYRQPISKAEIESIRGVNSQYSLRNLLMRGMIEKVSNPTDSRSVPYQTTTEFLMHMGLSSTKDLPEFEKLVDQIRLPETPGLTQNGEAPQEPQPAFEETKNTEQTIPEKDMTKEEIEQHTENTPEQESPTTENLTADENKETEDTEEEDEFEDDEDDEDEE